MMERMLMDKIMMMDYGAYRLHLTMLSLLILSKECAKTTDQKEKTKVSFSQDTPMPMDKLTQIWPEISTVKHSISATSL